jgi:hypothetical protein
MAEKNKENFFLNLSKIVNSIEQVEVHPMQGNNLLLVIRFTT